MKHSFTSPGVTNINYDVLKWPLKGEINHYPQTAKVDVCDDGKSNCLQFVTNRNL